MDLDLLPTFAAFVANDCNMTQTAAKLGLSQPTVHAQIKRLSDQMGQALYHRQGRKLSLTTRGIEVAAFATDILNATDRFLHQHQAPPTLVAGRGAWSALLPDFLTAPFPTPIIRQGEQIWQAVRRGEALIGLSAGPAPSGLHCQLFAAVGVRLMAPAGWSLSEDLNRTFILPSRGRPHRIACDRWLAHEGITPSKIVEVDDWQVTVALVKMQLGRSILNECYCPPDLPSVTLPWEPITYRFGWRPERQSTVRQLLRQWGA